MSIKLSLAAKFWTTFAAVLTLPLALKNSVLETKKTMRTNLLEYSLNLARAVSDGLTY